MKHVNKISSQFSNLQGDPMNSWTKGKLKMPDHSEDLPVTKGMLYIHHDYMWVSKLTLKK